MPFRNLPGRRSFRNYEQLIILKNNNNFESFVISEKCKNIKQFKKIIKIVDLVNRRGENKIIHKYNTYACR